MHFNWNTTLAPEEILQKEFTVSQRFLQVLLAIVIGGSLIVCFVNIFAGIVVFLCGLLYYFYLHKSKHYALTNKRLILVEAFIGSNTSSIDYSQMTDIEIEQSPIDQIGGWGTLVFNTAGTNSPTFRLSFIDHPQLIKQTLDAIRDKPILNIQ